MDNVIDSREEIQDKYDELLAKHQKITVELKETQVRYFSLCF